MRIKDPIGEAEEPFNLVPLTDMVFNLLIFFMCATTFAQIEKDVTVQLPRSTQTFRTLSAMPRELTINIRQDGATWVNGRQCSSDELGQLVAGFARERGATVIIRADERSIMKYFAGVAAVCRQSGIHDARVQYVDEGPVNN